MTTEATTTEQTTETTETTNNDEVVQAIQELRTDFKQFYDLYQAEIEKKETEKPILEEQKATEQQELLDYRTEIKKQLDEMETVQIDTKGVLEQLNPTLAEETNSLLSNTFDGTNALIGVVLGIAVAVAFIKGIAWNG